MLKRLSSISRIGSGGRRPEDDGRYPISPANSTATGLTMASSSGSSNMLGASPNRGSGGSNRLLGASGRQKSSPGRYYNALHDVPSSDEDLQENDYDDDDEDEAVEQSQSSNDMSLYLDSSDAASKQNKQDQREYNSSNSSSSGSASGSGSSNSNSNSNSSASGSVSGTEEDEEDEDILKLKQQLDDPFSDPSSDFDLFAMVAAAKAGRLPRKPSSGSSSSPNGSKSNTKQKQQPQQEQPPQHIEHEQLQQEQLPKPARKQQQQPKATVKNSSEVLSKPLPGGGLQFSIPTGETTAEKDKEQQQTTLPVVTSSSSTTPTTSTSASTTPAATAITAAAEAAVTTGMKRKTPAEQQSLPQSPLPEKEAKVADESASSSLSSALSSRSPSNSDPSRSPPISEQTPSQREEVEVEEPVNEIEDKGEDDEEQVLADAALLALQQEHDAMSAVILAAFQPSSQYDDANVLENPVATAWMIKRRQEILDKQMLQAQQAQEKQLNQSSSSQPVDLDMEVESDAQVVSTSMIPPALTEIGSTDEDEEESEGMLEAETSVEVDYDEAVMKQQQQEAMDGQLHPPHMDDNATQRSALSTDTPVTSNRADLMVPSNDPARNTRAYYYSHGHIPPGSSAANAAAAEALDDTPTLASSSSRFLSLAERQGAFPVTPGDGGRAKTKTANKPQSKLNYDLHGIAEVPTTPSNGSPEDGSAASVPPHPPPPEPQPSSSSLQERGRRLLNPKTRQGQIVWVLLFIMLVAIITVIVAVVLATQRDKNDNEDNSKTKSPTRSPIFFPPINSSAPTAKPSQLRPSAAPSRTLPPTPAPTLLPTTPMPTITFPTTPTAQPSTTPSTLQPTRVTQAPTYLRPSTVATTTVRPTAPVVPTAAPTIPLDSIALNRTARIQGNATVQLNGQWLNPDAVFGKSVALSSSGTILVVGASDADVNGLDRAGAVQVYQWVTNSTSNASSTTALGTGSWVRRGPALVGQNALDRFGSSVSISADGNYVAVGEPNHNVSGYQSGRVRVFRYNESTGIYQLLGSPIPGPVTGSHFGNAVSLSASGERVAVGAPHWDVVPSSNMSSNMRGQVTVYQYDTGAWKTMGQSLLGSGALDWLGWSVDISPDGNALVAGAPRNPGRAGYVRVFEWNRTAWVQKGNGDISNQLGILRSDDRFGQSVSIHKATGIPRVAIGAPWKDWNGVNASGLAVVYELNMTSNNWTLLGKLSRGSPSAGDQAGMAVKLLGDLVMVGHPGSNLGAGMVVLYSYSNGQWSQVPRPLQGTTFGGGLGTSIAVRRPRANALILASGAAGQGSVDVFEQQTM